MEVKYKKSLNSQHNAELTEQCWGVTIPDFQLQYRVTVTKNSEILKMLVQNSGSTEKPGQSQTPNAWQRCQRSTLEQDWQKQ